MPSPVPSSYPRLPYPIATLFLTLLIALTANAQSQITTGTIRGTVLDANGRPVAGARALPDGEILAGTPTPAIVPLPTLAMAVGAATLVDTATSGSVSHVPNCSSPLKARTGSGA